MSIMASVTCTASVFYRASGRAQLLMHLFRVQHRLCTVHLLMAPVSHSLCMDSQHRRVPVLLYRCTRCAPHGRRAVLRHVMYLDPFSVPAPSVLCGPHSSPANCRWTSFGAQNSGQKMDPVLGSVSGSGVSTVTMHVQHIGAAFALVPLILYGCHCDSPNESSALCVAVMTG